MSTALAQLAALTLTLEARDAEIEDLRAQLATAEREKRDAAACVKGQWAGTAEVVCTWALAVMTVNARRPGGLLAMLA